jgi:hypothetical protein
MGTYPSFAFTPDDNAVLIWAAGQIWHVPLSRTRCGERIAGSSEPRKVRFTAHIEKRLAETRSSTTEIVKFETADSVRVHAFKGLRIDEKGEKAVFEAAGETVVQHVGEKSTVKVPVLHPNSAYYAPTFVPKADALVLHARWSDTHFTTFEIANLTSSRAYEVHGLPMGRYRAPAVCDCSGGSRSLAFVKTAGDRLTGDVVATAKPGIYLAHIHLPHEASDKIHATELQHVLSEADSDDVLSLQFLNGNRKLLVQAPRRAFILDLAAGPDKFGKYQHTDVAHGRMSLELAVAPHSHGSQTHAAHVAFVDFHQVYITPPTRNATEAVWSKPGNATRGLARVSLDGGHDLAWSGDGSTLFWFLGK